MKNQEKNRNFTIFGYKFFYSSVKNTDTNFNTNNLWYLNIRGSKLGSDQKLFNNYILGLKLSKIDNKNKLQYMIRKQILKQI